MSERVQAFCRNCNRHTLHESNPREVNHVVHVLLTLFSCSCWLWVWILDIILVSMENAPYLCLHCGQDASGMTPQQAAIAQQRAMRQAQIDAQQAAAQQALREEERQERRERFQEKMDSIPSQVAALVKSLPGRIDRVLGVLAGGPENEILHWFMRVVAGVLALAMAIGGLFLMYVIAMAILPG